MQRANNKMLELMIPITKTDVPALQHNIKYIFKYLPVKKIVLIGADNIKGILPDNLKIEYMNENELYPNMNFGNIKTLMEKLCGTGRRTGWYFQQFIKMAYATICKDDYYLIWDGDTTPITNIDFFDKNTEKPFLGYRGHEKCDEPFYPVMEILLPNHLLKKTVQESYIAEHMLVNCKIMCNLISDIEANDKINGKYFYEKILNAIDSKVLNLSGFSEFETYATYVQRKYPDFYIERFWKNLRNGKTFFGNNPSKEQYNWASKEFITLSLEDFDRQYLISKLLCSSFFQRKLSFSTVYNIINPIYKCVYSARLLLRNIIYRKKS